MAVAEGLEVYAFEGATHWLSAEGLRFERTAIARQPFPAWLAQQPAGTVIVAAAAGRALPLEWLPSASRPHSGRPGNFGVVTWAIGERGSRRRSERLPASRPIARLARTAAR